MKDVSTDILIDDKLIRMELFNARKSKKMTQQNVSDKSGLSLSTISNIESGDAESQGITLKSLIKYADSVGCKLFVKSYNIESKEDD